MLVLATSLTKLVQWRLSGRHVCRLDELCFGGGWIKVIFVTICLSALSNLVLAKDSCQCLQSNGRGSQGCVCWQVQTVTAESFKLVWSVAVHSGRNKRLGAGVLQCSPATFVQYPAGVVGRLCKVLPFYVEADTISW